jgi:hypothetical protein
MGARWIATALGAAAMLAWGLASALDFRDLPPQKRAECAPKTKGMTKVDADKVFWDCMYSDLPAQKRAECTQRTAGKPDAVNIFFECMNSGEARSVDPNSLEGRLTRVYGERCKLAGYQPGTGAFGQCLLAYSDRDEAMRQAVAAQLAGQVMAQRAQPQGNPYYIDPNMFKNIAPPTPQMRQCTSIVGNQIIQTTCY